MTDSDPLSAPTLAPRAHGMRPLIVLTNDDGVSSPGLVVLPTHRVVFGVEGFDAEKLTRQLQEFCELKRTTSSGAMLLAELAELGDGRQGVPLRVRRPRLGAAKRKRH